MYRHASNSQWLDVVGIDCHIGSQIATPGPLLEALRSLLRLVDQLEAEGIRIEHLDLGGGFGVVYRDEPEFDVVRVRNASEAPAARARLDAARGTRPLPRRERWRAADAGRISQARRHERPAQFRDPRRGDERFDSPDAVSGVASDTRGRSADTRCAARPLGSRGSRLRIGRLPRPRPRPDALRECIARNPERRCLRVRPEFELQHAQSPCRSAGRRRCVRGRAPARNDRRPTARRNVIDGRRICRVRSGAFAIPAFARQA